MAGLKSQSILLNQLIEEGRIDEAKSVLNELNTILKTESDTKTTISKLTNYLTDFKDRLSGRKNDSIIPTGFKCIDDRVFGAVKGNIMTICARSGGGKTTLGVNIALNMCKKHKVGFISLEMTEEEIGDKIVSNIANIDNGDLTLNTYSNNDIENLKNNSEEIKRAFDSINMAYDCYDIDSLCDTIENMADMGCEVIFIDWLGMIEAKGNAQYEKIRVIMNELKRVSKEKNVAIIAMQQLNRQMDGSNRRPSMYDIADGSAIEKISAPVIILRSAEGGMTEVSFFKTRRLNSKAFTDTKTGYVDYEEMLNGQFKNELQYCRFVDTERNIKKQETAIAQDNKPF